MAFALRPGFRIDIVFREVDICGDRSSYAQFGTNMVWSCVTEQRGGVKLKIREGTENIQLALQQQKELALNTSASLT